MDYNCFEEKINGWNSNLLNDVTKRLSFLSPPIVKEYEQGNVSDIFSIFTVDYTDVRSDYPQSGFEISVTYLKPLEQKAVCIQRSAAFSLDFDVEDTHRFWLPFYNDTADYLAEQYQLIAADILTGLYSPGGALYLTHAVDYDSPISLNTIFAAQHKLGDAANNLTTSLFHHDTIYKLINTEMKRVSSMSYSHPERTGMQLIENDFMPKIKSGDKDKRLSLLIGKESIYFKILNLSVKPYFSQNRFCIRIDTRFYLHVNGVSYNLDNRCPSDADLRNPSTWKRVIKKDKDIKIVAILTPAE